MPITLNALVYKTVIIPVLRYGSETEMLKKKLLERTYMIIWRWIMGIKRTEKIWNKYIRPSASKANISEKIREAMLR